MHCIPGWLYLTAFSHLLGKSQHPDDHGAEEVRGHCDESNNLKAGACGQRDDSTEAAVVTEQ
jgi:hypothetical protein